MNAAIQKIDAGPGDEVGHGARNEYLARFGQAAHGARALECHTRDTPLGRQIALSRVQAEGSGTTKPRSGARQGACAGDGSRRTVERGEESVGCEREAAPPELGDFLLHVSLERGPVAGVVPRLGDARAQHRGQHAISRRHPGH